MPLTRKIIDEVVSNSIKTELIPVNQRLNDIENKLSSLENGLGKKIDNLTNIVTDLAGQFQKFDKEQTVLSGHVSQHGDILDKLHLKVFGKPAFS